MRILRPAVLMLALLIAGHAHAAEPDVFSSPTAGFKVTKPSGWHFMSAEQNKANLKAVKMNDQEFQQAMEKYATAPLVAMTKHEEPYADVNPSFRVNIRALGDLKGKPPVELAGLLVPQLQKVFKDFDLVQPPIEIVVSGHKSAYVRMNYTLETADGGAYPTTSELWIVPRGDYFFMVGAGTRTDEKTGTRKEIAAILKTVKIDPQPAGARPLRP